MEEDTGKLIHQDVDGLSTSLVDFNRSSLPLVEIVTEPDFHNAEDVIEYLQRLQQIVRYLDVSNADMEKGDMRLEPNISLTKNVILGNGVTPESIKDPGQARMTEAELPNYKVEVKNINSFRFVGKSIEYEVKRQEEILEDGKTPLQETRGWNESKNATVSQRVKEEANDYRYFPEPDIPPIRLTKGQISSLKERVPELPVKKIERFVKDFGISEYDAEILTREKDLADYFEKAVSSGKEKNVTAKQIANAIINKKIDYSSTPIDKLISDIAESFKVETLDESELQKIIDKVISENEKAVNDFKSGKESVIMFLVGQCMRLIGRKVDVTLVKDALIKTLAS